MDTDEDAQSDTPMKLHDDFDFPDGDVVLLVTGSNQNGELDDANARYYRVHTLILKLHSNVLSDMFSVGTPELQYTEGGLTLPMVQLHDDPVDMERLLHALYHQK